MGTDKAERIVGGKPMALWVVEALRSHLDDVVVVGREGRLAGLDAIPDAWPGRPGPLAGLATALTRFGRPVLLVAVDQPLLRAETVDRLLTVGDDHQALVPYDEGHPQVTCARYPAEWAEAAVETLQIGGSIRDMLAKGHQQIEPGEWRRWGEDGRSWWSMDDEAAILEAERRFRVSLA